VEGDDVSGGVGYQWGRGRRIWE